MQCSRVDFPAPFGPIRQVSEPRSTSNPTSCTALTAPNDFETPSTTRAGPRPFSPAMGRDYTAGVERERGRPKPPSRRRSVMWG
jgi:hypothetical protein